MSVSSGREGQAGAKEGPIQWALLITRTMGPLGKAGREGLWILLWFRETTSGFLCPRFPCPLPGSPCPSAQRSRALPWPLCPFRDKAEWKVMAGKGIQAKQAVEPQEAISGWEPGSEAGQAAQRTHSGKTGGRRMGLLAAGWGPTSARDLRPASDTVQGSRPPGGSGVAAGSSGGDVSMAPEPGSARSWVLCGAGRGEAKAEGTLQAGRRLSQRACSPPPFPRTGLASLGYKRGAGTMGVLCPGEALKDPRPMS